MYHYGNAPFSLQSLSDASEIKMKHARSSFDYQLQKRTEAEDALKQYVSHSQNYTISGEGKWWVHDSRDVRTCN